MAETLSTGAMKHRVGFALRFTSNPDSPIDYGNTVDEWVEQFEERAQYIHLRGGETVMAARLEGRHVQIMRIHASERSRQITTDWLAYDKATEVTYNIRDVTQDEGGRFIDVLCESGVAP